MRPRQYLVAAVLLITFALPAVSANAADTSGLRVDHGANSKFLIFRSAACSIGKRNGFQAVAYEKGWRLLVSVRPFSGFHHYKLVRGEFTGTYIDLASPSGETHYATDFSPPYHVVGGGAIDFSGNGSMMGAGFLFMFNEDGSDALDVFGGLRCHYPQRKHRR